MSQKNSTTGLSIVKIFLLIVFLATGISILIKGFNLFQKSALKTSSYSLLILDKKAFVYTIDSSAKTLTVLEVEKPPRKIYLPKDKKIHTFIGSLELGIPIDGVVQVRSPRDFEAEDILSFSTVLQVLFNQQNYQYSAINKMDILKAYLASKDIEEENRKHFTALDRASTQKVLGESTELFKDSTAAQEAVSIEVINQSGVNGFGTRVGEMLQASGFNVVSITSDEVVPKSLLTVRTEENDTASRIRTIFPFPVRQDSGSAIADISISLGSDIADDTLGE